VSCNANCTLNPGQCTIPPKEFCGDGIKNGSEQCDKTDLGGATCASVTGNPNATGVVTCNANCTLNPGQCTIPSASCGDGVKNGSEQCDKTDLGGATCASVTGNPNAIGTVSCNANCTLNNSQCIIPAPICGNNKKENAEQCDGSDLGGATCKTFTGNPDATGSLSCLGNCTIDGSQCQVPTCGGQICPVGQQACGQPCQAPCPSDSYCLTGCCVKIQL
jgi:hypothetical protein